MEDPSLADLQNPYLLERRWKNIKTAIYNLVVAHEKFELYRALLALREEYTSAPSLSEITNFTGFDVAIKTIQGWDWTPKSSSRSVETDAVEIGKYGAELMVVHTIRESIRNNLLKWDGEELSVTPRGAVHFDALNSFNVDITGSRMDIAKKRFTQSRLTKQQRQMDPLNKIPIVKYLYWENSILMLLRAPLPFYQAMSELTDEEQDYLLELHAKLVSKSSQENSGLVRVRLTKNSKAAELLEKLTPPSDTSDRRPRFVVCIRNINYRDENKVEFHIGLGAMTMFTMFLMGFDRDHLDDKAQRAEIAVREVIEQSGMWKVYESNIEVIQESGEVITEIDVIAQSTSDSDQWLTCEVKDFSFWRGWIFGHGRETRREYYKKAVEKLTVKEEFIREKFDAEDITSIIVTSVPESYSTIEGVSLVYLSDLSEELARQSSVNYTPRKRHHSSNFLIRYFQRLKSDYTQADQMRDPMKKLETQIEILKEELQSIKEEYEGLKNTYLAIKSELETLNVSERLAKKRFVKDSGERHYQLEDEIKRIQVQIRKVKMEKKVKVQLLKELKKNYDSKLQMIKEKEREAMKYQTSIDRLLAPRLF